MLRSCFFIFIFTLIFAPLALGSVEQWSLTIIESLCLMAVAIFFIYASRKKEFFLYEIPGILPLVCIWVYFILQIVPLPAFIVEIISPMTYQIYSDTVGIVEHISWISLSINKKETFLQFLKFTGYLAFYILTIQLLTEKELLKKTVYIIVFFSSALAIFSLIQHLSGTTKIYWFRETFGASPFGPFVNRNHYAGFMGMLFPIAFGLFLAAKPKFSSKTIFQKIKEFLKEKKNNMYILIGLGAVIIAFSIFLTLSRGGIISLSLSMLFFTAMLLMKKATRKRQGLIILIICLIVIFVSWFGWDPIISRFEKILTTEGNIADLRVQMWLDSLQIIKDFPLTGTGFGTFIDIYPKYASIKEEIIIEHAHNDYIELLTNGGIIAFLLSGWFVFAVIFKSYRSFSQRRDSYAIYLYIGGITGCISILLHSFTDFNFQIGANGLYFFFLMGLIVSLANTRLHSGLGKTYLKPVNFKTYKMLPILVSFAFLFVTISNLGILIGSYYYSFIKDLRLEKVSRNDLIEVKEMALKASLIDPLESAYIYSAANVDILLKDIESAKKYYINALKLNPLNGEYVQRLGLLLHADDKGIAERMLKTGILSEPTNDSMYKTYAAWLISEGRKDEAFINLNIALSISPNKTSDYITFMTLNGLNDDDIQSTLPMKSVSYIAFADYLINAGNEKKAEEAYAVVLQISKNPKEDKAIYFQKIYNFYFERERYEEALNAAQQAKILFPSNAGFRNSAGFTYEKLGMLDMAVKEYNEALMLDKGNKQAKKRLKILTETERIN